MRLNGNALSRYYEHDYWVEVPEIQDYVNADTRLDLEYDDLPWDRLREVRDKVIESHVKRANTEKVQVELPALREHIQERDTQAAEMAAAQEEQEERPQHRAGGRSYHLRIQGEGNRPPPDNVPCGHI
jgi:hypothetical protein